MKEVNENTIGGRIRKARISCKLTTGELARAVGVSQNYISVVERNDKKQASPALLRKIAEVTGVSPVWLKDGKSAVTEVAHFKDIQLLLTVIMQQEQNVTKETVASVLAVDAETVDKILSGEAEYNPQWESGLSNLVQRLDLPAIRKKIHVLDAFLQREEEKKNNAKLFWSFRKAVSKMQKRSFWFVGNPVRIQDDPECTLYVLQSEDGMVKWNIRYYPSFLDEDDVEEAFDRVSEFDENEMAMTYDAVAFSNKESYASFYRHYNSIVRNSEAMASLRGVYSQTVIQILLLLVDGDSGDVVEINDLFYECGFEDDDVL